MTAGNNRGVIRVLTTDRPAAWQAVLSSIGQYDFYHTADYHALEEVREKGRAELIIYAERGEMLAVPLLLCAIERGKMLGNNSALWDAKSVYGYIGWLSSRGVSPDMTQRFGGILKDMLGARGVVSVFGRMHPLLDHINQLPSVGKVDVAGNTIAVDLRRGLASYERGVAEGHAYEIRKLREMGCEVVHDRQRRYLSEFTEMYAETMRRRGAKAHYYFTADEFHRLLVSKQFDAQLHLVRYRGKICAMAMFVVCGKLIQYHLSCSREGITKYPATKLLVDEVCRQSIGAGHKWLHLGGGLGGRKDSLYEFKLRFGGQELPFRTWQWILRPQDYERLTKSMSEPIGDRKFFPAYRHTII